MKMITIGLIQTTLSPFIVIFGSLLMSSFKVSDDAMFFACMLGGGSVILNFLIGCALIVRGYQDSGTFKGW